ncbi:MAG: AAA family ATPase [Chloroflexales bacterium]
MRGARLLQTIRIRDLLSYGSASEEIALQPLNVLIGAHASGKSNLIEAISLLQATPTDLTLPIRQGGGISDWLWKGGYRWPTRLRHTGQRYPLR